MRPSLFLRSLCLLSTVFASYDQNRGGAVLKAPEGESFTSVTGTFTVPNLTGNSRLAIWVAIGDTLNQDYVLKGGVKYDQTLSTFAEWFPANTTDTTSVVPVKASDSIVVTVSIDRAAPTTGIVVIENKTQDKKTTQTITAPDSWAEARLTSLAADWFVQAFQSNGELVQVPRFGTISFSDVGATLVSGKTVSASGAGTYEIQGTSGQIYSRTSVTDMRASFQRGGGIVIAYESYMTA